MTRVVRNAAALCVLGILVASAALANVPDPSKTTMTGGGWGVGAQHNHNLESWFVHSPGLKVVMPSTAEASMPLSRASPTMPSPPT